MTSDGFDCRFLLHLDDFNKGCLKDLRRTIAFHFARREDFFVGKKFVYSLALAASLPLILGGCVTTTTKPAAAQPTLMDKVSASVKSGSNKVAAAVSPAPSPAAKPAAPTNAKPGPNIFVAMAQAAERQGNLDEAEAKYKKALSVDANHLGAMVGYAHLEDHRDHFESATKLYQKAIKKYPKDPSLHNDLGLCDHRRGKLSEATKELQRAVELKGDSKLYRDNLAAVYVEQGKTKEALAQLITAHGESVGHYNLAYLLVKKHDNAAALSHFRTAAAKDPSLVAAKQWIAKLSLADNEAEPRGNVRVAMNTVPHSDAAMEQLDQNASFAAAPVAPPTNRVPQLVRTSSVASAPQSAGSKMETRGVQFPQLSRTNDAPADAIPPLPDQAH